QKTPLKALIYPYGPSENPPKFSPRIYLEFHPKELSAAPEKKAQPLVRRGREAVRQPFIGNS
ncbi:MAG: hypothetical protein ACPGAD_06645, partial [Pseudomonadales bacterium]